MRSIHNLNSRLKTFKYKYVPDYSHELLRHKLSPSNKVMSKFYWQLLDKPREDARLKKGLWWAIRSPMIVSKSAVVRNWTRKRFTSSFKEALEASGYDQNGVLLKEHGVELYGTLKVWTSPNMITLPVDLVQEETRELMDCLKEAAMDPPMDPPEDFRPSRSVLRHPRKTENEKSTW